MKQWLALLCLMTVMVSCGRTNSGFVKYHDDGRQKPIVALVPVQNNSDILLPWSVEQELTEGIRERLREGGELFVVPDEQIETVAKGITPEEMRSKDLSFAKRFVGKEFVVLAELVEHKEVPYERRKISPLYIKDGEISTVLMLTMRVRVIDIRSDEPQVILQSMVNSNHMVPSGRGLADLDYNAHPWGSHDYCHTPVFSAHSRLQRDVAQQIEEYIVARRWLGARV